MKREPEELPMLYIGVRGGTWRDEDHKRPFHAGPNTPLPRLSHLTDAQIEAGIDEKARDVSRTADRSTPYRKKVNDSHRRLRNHLFAEKLRRHLGASSKSANSLLERWIAWFDISSGRVAEPDVYHDTLRYLADAD